MMHTLLSRIRALFLDVAWTRGSTRKCRRISTSSPPSTNIEASHPNRRGSRHGARSAVSSR